MDKRPAERLRKARENAGKSPQEVAAAVGMNVPSYCDLEAEGYDELWNNISLAELRDICRTLGIHARDLFEDAAGQERASVVSFALISDSLRRHLSHHNTALDAFENQVGWSLATFLEDPEAAWDWNVDGLRDVCRPLLIEWLDALPR